MIRPAYLYDCPSDGAVIARFTAAGDFAASEAATAWLGANGFAVGPMQAADPRGVMHGDFAIGKWRDLRPLERDALHGVMLGDPRRGPIDVVIFATAPAAAHLAIVGAGEPLVVPAPVGRPDLGITLGLTVILLAIAGGVLMPSERMPRGKFELRVVSPIAAPAEMRRAGR